MDGEGDVVLQSSRAECLCFALFFEQVDELGWYGLEPASRALRET
jgi:hypothetical protein